ncbi:MAG TPA: dienelactone hydrolase family protein [Jatrophihabitans sp.]
MNEDLSAKTITITSGDGSAIQAYSVTPEGEGRAASRGGVVLIHHLPGYDRGQKELARHVAELGYDVVVPNLYWRQAPGASPDDAAAAARANGGKPDTELVSDVAGAAAHLRALPTSNGKVGVIGYCSGGRQSVLAACNVHLDAAVDNYGAFVIGDPPEGSGMTMTGIEEQLPNLRCPLLGLFGNDDKFPPPADVDKLEQILTANGKTVEIHRYDDAAHAFFSTERPSYRVHAANDGWARIAAFYGKYLAS